MIKKFLILLIVIVLNTNYSFANKAEKINVAFTIDNNYPIFTLLSINSILKNNVSNSDYMFYIIENNLTDKNKKKMEKFVKKRNQEIEFINIDKPLLKNKELYVHDHCKHVTEIAMARVYLPEILSNDINKVIYLDADTLVLTDLKELYNEDLHGFVAGMVLDISGKVDFKNKIFSFKKDYYNSGVILIDLKKAREENSTQNFVEYYNNEILPTITGQKVGKRYSYPDQDLINIVWKGKIKKVHYKWNMQAIKFQDEGIIHYITKVKPWAFIPYWYDYRLSSKKIYIKYWNECKDLRIYRHYYVLKSIYRDYLNIVRNNKNSFEEFLNKKTG